MKAEYRKREKMQQQTKVGINAIIVQNTNVILKVFVPGHLLLPLSRDKGTPGQGKCPCPGTKGQRDVPSRFVPGRPAGRLVPWKHYFRTPSHSLQVFG